MSLMRQKSLLCAGCQPWNSDVSAVCDSDWFAYCSTLAIYIFQYDTKCNEYRLHSIMAEHKKTIVVISWNTQLKHLLASASNDGQIIIWDVQLQRIVTQHKLSRVSANCIDWVTGESMSLSYVSGKGPLTTWNYSTGTHKTNKETNSFSSEVTRFRWHPSKSTRIALGHADGSLSIIDNGQNQKHVLNMHGLMDDAIDEPVIALEWDPLSNDYLLVCNKQFGVRLIDTASISVIMTFQLPSAAAEVQSLDWVHDAPGMFVTGDSKSGILRLWTVSKSAPIENIRVKKTGFQSLHVFSMSKHSQSNVSSRTIVQSHQTPATQVVCTFQDGGVGVYSVKKRKWVYLREEAHVETIFDCRFKPDNADMLATASFDGTIKVWDLNSWTPINTSPGNEGIIYTISWAPFGVNCIAAATSKAGVFIWDIDKNKISNRYSLHGSAAVHCVAWNQRDTNLIASTGADCYCIIYQTSGEVRTKYKHPGTVYCCDWNPGNKDMIATSCEDKNVRLYYLATANDSPLKVFSGHTAKVFQVRWSPLRDGVLCSGSDDCTVRLWDYSQEGCVRVLQGHMAPVRGLVWSTELPYLLASGSWDATIRVWDTRDGTCVDAATDHGADVYGLTTHPDRPFLMASCSRDSTVRLWSLAPHTHPLQIKILAGFPMSDILPNSEQTLVLGAPPILVGHASKDLKGRSELAKTDSHLASVRLISQFFGCPDGEANLWQLVDVHCGRHDELQPVHCRDDILHMTHTVRHIKAKAQELQMGRSQSFSLGSQTEEDRLHAAADMYLRVGNVESYCQLMCRLGQWDKALAVAPAVSFDFWRTLVNQRMENALSSVSDDDPVPYCAAAGRPDKLVQYFVDNGRLHDAFTVAVASNEALFTVKSHKPSQRNSSLSEFKGAGESVSLLSSTSHSLANWYFNHGNPIQAACCLFAANNIQGSLDMLLRGHELELLVSIGLVTDVRCSSFYLAVDLLARRCERLDVWSLAVELLQRLHCDPKRMVMMTCMKHVGSQTEASNLRKQASIPSEEECLSLAQQYKASRSNIESIEFFLLSSTPEQGLDLGMNVIKGLLSKAGWQVMDVWPLLQLLACVRLDVLQHHRCQNDLLMLCAYTGGLMAIRRQYTSVVKPLFDLARKLVMQELSDMGISETQIASELDVWLRHQLSLNRNGEFSEYQERTYGELMSKVGSPSEDEVIGVHAVAGCKLPSHSEAHVSVFSEQLIQGPAYYLEDGKTAISLNDSLMWATVNPFSPLGSCCYINPF